MVFTACPSGADAHTGWYICQQRDCRLFCSLPFRKLIQTLNSLVIRLMMQNAEAAVNLLEKNHAHQLMRKGHF